MVKYFYMFNFYMDSLPEELIRKIYDALGSQGNFLFLAPVCKKWYKTVGSRQTNLKHMMASASTIRESGKTRGGSTTLARQNAWGFLAKVVGVEQMADELIQVIGWDEFSVGTAGHHGNLGFIKWVDTTTLGWDPHLALSSSASAGKFEFLKSMYTLGYAPNQRSVVEAARTGSVEIINWMNEIGCDMRDVTQVFAEESHLGPLKWATSNGFPCDELTLDAAVYANFGDVVRYVESYLIEVNRTRR